MKCATCQFDNPAAMRFCGQCGAPLAQRCPECKAEIPPGFKFCGQCGASLQPKPVTSASEGSPGNETSNKPLPVPAIAAYTPKHLAEKILRLRSSLEGERRQVTVLFADVAGFTALSEQLDPEDVHRIINRCFEVITAEVHRFEGTINQYTGDGVMALFGAPIAHEDSPSRAAYAALGIQRALRELTQEFKTAYGVTVQMRIGLNTGPVVVGKIGDDLRMDYTAVGDTTNLAARMQQMARPGSVLASAATYNLVAGVVEALDLGELQVKGHTPIRAWELLRARSKRSRIEIALERGLSPFIGRERELALLLDRFKHTQHGHGQVVLVAGEAGIGKSRLLLEFRRRLVDAGDQVTWLEGQCVSFGQSIPLVPILDQLRKNFGIDELDGEAEIIAKIEHGMRRLGHLEPHIPYVRYVLSVDPGDAAIAVMDPATRRKNVFAALRALTLAGAAVRPLVMVVEDLHWLDTSSEEFLATLIDSAAAMPIMLLLTYRVGHTLPFGTRSFVTSITLTNLSEQESLSLAGSILGGEELPLELKSALLDKAEGVPLFLEEVTKALLDLGVLRREGDRLVLGRSMAEVNVPDTIQGIIMARLDRLGDDGKRMVQLASVIGRQFLVRLLDRVGGMKERLEQLLRELLALEIIYEKNLLPEPAYVFKHAVIQDVAYNTLLTERRRELHRAVGNAIEELYQDRLAEHYEELAHHFVNGEQWEKAFQYLLRAGDRAKEAYANQLALNYYAKTLELLPRVSPALDRSQALAIHQRRSQVWLLLSRYPDAIAESEKMRDLARDLGDRYAEGEALMDLALAHWATFRVESVPMVRACAAEALVIARETSNERLLARSLWGMALVEQVDGRLDDADAKLTESLQIAERQNFSDIAVQTRVWLGAHANWRGEFRRAIPLCLAAERGATEVHDGFQELLALAFRCLALTALGEYAEGYAVMQDGLSKARERNNAFILGRLTNSLGWFHQELGDFRRAIEFDREAVEIGQRAKNGNVEVSALINLAYDYLHLGEVDRSLGLLQDTLIRVEKHGFGAHRWRWSNHLSLYLAEAMFAAGQHEQARSQTETALAQALATGSMKYISKAHVLRGEIAIADNQFAQAEIDLRESLRIARAIAYPPLTWQGSDLLARALRGLNRLEEAHDIARFAVETIDTIAARLPDEQLRQTFLGWDRVHGARETFAQLQRL